MVDRSEDQVRRRASQFGVDGPELPIQLAGALTPTTSPRDCGNGDLADKVPLSATALRVCRGALTVQVRSAAHGQCSNHFNHGVHRRTIARGQAAVRPEAG